MAISKIQYDDKVAINIDNTIPDINKCNASDLNEIKSVVNNNADEIPTISDEYGTSTTDGYSQNYINENTINPSGEPSTSEEDVSSATFTNTLEAPMNIDLKGNTSQVQLSGKNKMYVNDIPLTSRPDVSYSCTDGVLTLNGTLTSGLLIDFDNFNLPAGTYIFNSWAINMTGSYARYFIDNDDSSNNRTNSGNPITLTSTHSCHFRFYANAGTVFTNAKVYAQIELGETRTDYEQYCGGTPSPNPSYPQDIHNVSGNNSVVVCGKNLLRYPYTNTSKEQNSLVFTDNGNGTITITGKATADTIFDFYQNANVMLVSDTTKTYTLSSSIDATNWTFQYYERYNNTWNYKTGGKTLSFTPSSEATGQIFRLLINNNTQINGTFTFQLEQGNQATTYEAYNGTTYNIDLPVENLFDKSTISNNTWLLQDGTTEAHNDFCVSDYIRVDELQNYYLPKTNTIRLKYYNSSKQALTNNWDISSGSNDQVITIPTNAYYVRITIQYNVVDINTYQFEQGNKPNKYTPYGTTPIELNKIGTYQDYFYKDNDKWYLHKEIGKVVLNGSESWDYTNNPTSTNYAYITTTIIDNLTANNYSGYCDNFENYNTWFIYNTSTNKEMYSCGSGTSPKLRFMILKSRLSSLDTTGVKNWFTNNNTSVYYVLATPTNTEITYTLLIEQLESIKNAMSKEGTTNITQVNNDAPFILDLSVFNDTYNGRYESLDNQVQINTSDISELQEANNYSTEEQVIGTWLGKPLYRRVIEISNPTLDSWTNFNHNISNMDFGRIANATLTRVNAGETAYIPISIENVSTGALFTCNLQKTIFQYKIAVFSNITKLTAVLEYTKTTD